ncbi:hypothetical protein [Sphingomonas sp. UYP23]
MVELSMIKPALHFVGFRGDEHHSAVQIWGRPNFIHPVWDRWARLDMHADDTAIFARGSGGSPGAVQSPTLGITGRSSCRWDRE